MSADDFRYFAGDRAHESANPAPHQLDGPLPIGDWAELGRQILAEAARRAIAERAGASVCRASRESERRSGIELLAEDRA